MILVKQRQVPRKLLFYQTVKARLPVDHPLQLVIEEDIRRCEAGFSGEQRLDQMLLAKYHGKNNFLIPGLRLPYGDGSFFQIDTLLLNPTHMIPIEVKNITGELLIDRQLGQMIQTVGDKQYVYEDPLTQAQIQAEHFYHWMISRGFPSIAVEPLVMLSNSNCILRMENKDDTIAKYRICRGRKILFRIDDLDDKHRNNILTPEQLQELSHLIIQEDTEPSFDFEKIFKIPRTHLLPGVHCPTCRCLGMKYYYGAWICPRCRCKSYDAHLHALRDYYLLWGPEINNAMFRWFLGIESPDIAYQILKKLNLQTNGARKFRCYLLTWDLFT